MARQASIVVSAGRYQRAAIILMGGVYPVGQITVLDVYERDGETCVKLGVTLPDDIYAARVDAAGLSEEWVAEREREYTADAGHNGSNGSNGHGAPSASGSSGSYRDPRAVKGGQSSARWRKPDRREGLPNHNGRRW